MATVTIIMGSKSDLPGVKPAYDTLKEFGIDTEMLVLSAHRTPDEVAELTKNADKKGIKVFIAAAGKAAHLAGVIAAGTVRPVIGIPVKSSFMDGLDSLLSTVQMPNGIPVATVAVGGSVNAALLAVQMLALSSPELSAKLLYYKEKMKKDVLAQNESLQKEI